MSANPRSRTVLVAGGSGYVGSQLLVRLDADGYRVRCLARRPEALRARVPPGVEVVRGDVLGEGSLASAMLGVDTAVYLIHSMGEGDAFAETDRLAANTFGAAARRAGLRKIVYLGGLGDERLDLSAHLRSRHEVGHTLAASGVPVVELRAAVILGSGSLSFELIRALVERLPVMVTPRWMRVPTQPIWIGDVLEALSWAIRREPPCSAIFDIGGADVVSYGDLVREYARQRGLRRWMIPVPMLTPRLSSLWLALVTPHQARVGRALVESIRHPTVVRRDAALPSLPTPPLGVAEAIARILAGEDREHHDAPWATANGLAAAPRRRAVTRLGNRLLEARAGLSSATPAELFAAVERIGGRTGWYAAGALWRVRGWLDLLAGGVGMRRGRRDRERLVVSDVVDRWRVEEIEPGKRLLLRTEMRIPGRAWLEFVVEPGPGGKGSALLQTAIFDPLGLAGLAYWYALLPLHQWVFGGMLRGLVRSAEENAHPPRRSGDAAGGHG